MLELEKSADIAKRQEQERKADRASKARAVYAQKRERECLTKWAHAVRSKKEDFFALMLGNKPAQCAQEHT